MYRFGLLVVALLVAFAGCGTTDPMKIAPSVLPNQDFNYDSIWEAGMGAVQVHFPSPEWCNKDDMKIVSFYRPEPDIDVTLPYEYAKRAFLTIIPREAPEGTTYDITVHVGKYWRPRNPWKESQEGWSLIRWDRELEKKIIEEFKEHTILEQRRRQAHDKFDKHRKRGW